MENEKDRPLVGTVTSRKCAACGHHEMGFTTKNGVFYPLRPGSLIQVLEKDPHEGHEYSEPASTYREFPKTDEARPEYRAWIPDPVKGYRAFRLKYGVMIAEEIFSGGKMDGNAYEKAYLEKLWHLIEKEIHIPVAVLLDQYFSAPHLASGNPGEIAIAMFNELEEIREPVSAVLAWLENPCEETGNNLILSKTEVESDDGPADVRTLEKELNELSLEEFLGLL